MTSAGSCPIQETDYRQARNCWTESIRVKESADLTKNTHTNVKAVTEHFPQILQAKFQCISTDNCLSTPVKAGIILRSRLGPNWNKPHWKAAISVFNATSFNRLLLYLLCFLRSSSSFRHTWWFCSSHLKLGRETFCFQGPQLLPSTYQSTGNKDFEPLLITRLRLSLKKGPWLTGLPASTALPEWQSYCVCNLNFKVS